MSDTHHAPFRSLGVGAGLLLAAGLVLATGACSSAGPGTDVTIDRELFISTYVDLRVAALDSDTRMLSSEARSDVLARRGVTEEELMRFADVHGRDVELMRDVWNEVELRLDARRPEAEPR